MNTFKGLDSDGNGVLTRDELITGLSKVGLLFGSVIDVDEIMNKLDTNGSGSIDFSGNLSAVFLNSRICCCCHQLGKITLEKKDRAGI